MDKTPLVLETDYSFQFDTYDNEYKWLFDNRVYRDIMRDGFVFVFFIMAPFVGYLLYRYYWWSLSKNIWVPRI